MIIKASSRGSYRNLANHLTNTRDNDHVTLHEMRGLAGSSLHAGLAEIDAVSRGTRCQKPFFSVSFNPPMGQQVTHAQFDEAFAKLERKLGLVDQPRAVIYHEKEGRRHCHVVWSRIDSQEMKAIDMSHFKLKCTDISRELYQEHGWQMPKGLINKQDRDPFKLSSAEWAHLKRKGVDPKEIKSLIQNAWQSSDNKSSFSHALKERGLFLAKGDRRGFVVMDHMEKIYSLSRNGGLKTRDIMNKLGKPDDLPSVTMTAVQIRSIYNSEMLKKVRELKSKQRETMLPLLEKKALMVSIQRAERQEMQDRHRLKRRATTHAARDGFRRGIMGLFDKVTGKETRLRLVARKSLQSLKDKHGESRQKQIFRHNTERSELQIPIQGLRSKHRSERAELAKQILELRTHKQVQSRGILSNTFETSNLDQTQERDKGQVETEAQEQTHKRQRTREEGGKRKRKLDR